MFYMQWDDRNDRPGSPLVRELPLYSYGYLPCVMPDAEQPGAEHELMWVKEPARIVGSWINRSEGLRATAAQINARHLVLEAAPIKVFGSLIDCDERSEMRMRNTIEQWDSLEVQPGTIELVIVDGAEQRVVHWTMGDNSIQTLTLTQLQSVFNEMLRQRAIRGSKLFAALRSFKANPETTVSDLDSMVAWGLEPEPEELLEPEGDESPDDGEMPA